MSRILGGRFVLERKIGVGGMSEIFLGKDEVLDRPVAVKVLRAGFAEDEVGSRFRREGRTAARLSHPNVVQVYDAGEDELDGREVSYIVMEYVSDGDLGDLTRVRGPLSERELARIGADVASGLAHAHEKGIVHRDIKPQNILIDSYGRPKLTDFGIARALDATVDTRTGSYLGTASYSSPEQLKGGEITTKSDVYSLGCTLYETAVGEPPFFGGPLEVANQQLTKEPVPPRARGASLSEPFEDLVLSCLAKDPAARPSAAGLQERLLRLSALAAGAVAAKPSRGETTTRNLTGAAGVAAKGFETVVRGLAGRAGSAGASAETSRRTLVSPPRVSPRPSRRGRSRRRSLFAGAAVLLVLSVGAMAAVLTHSGTWGPSQNPFGGGEVADEQAVQQPQEDAVEEEAPVEGATGETTAAPSAPAPPPSQAENAVYDMYVKSSYRNVGASWAHLSERKKGEVGSQDQWAKQFDNLYYVFFTQMPEAQISGDRGTVNFTVQETRNYVPSTKKGTWEVVNEGGEWKLDRLLVNGSPQAF